MTKFEGFPPEVCARFEGLEADNTRENFAATRDFFERYRDRVADDRHGPELEKLLARVFVTRTWRAAAR